MHCTDGPPFCRVAAVTVPLDANELAAESACDGA
jgi:hypothetical protein